MTYCNKFDLLRQIQSLNEKEKQLSGQKAAIHHDQICLLFSLGQRIEQLRQACEFGEYKVRLAEISMCWSDADRKRKVWLYFGQYRAEPWIYNFGKSALQEMVYGKKEPDQEIIEAAITLAKSGVKVGVAWVQLMQDRKKSNLELGEELVVPTKKTRLSAKVRKLVHKAVDEIGEEELVKILSRLFEDSIAS